MSGQGWRDSHTMRLRWKDIREEASEKADIREDEGLKETTERDSKGETQEKCNERQICREWSKGPVH